jgi:FkbH-like protein
MKETFVEILNNIKKFKGNSINPMHDIIILSNITIHQLIPYVEYTFQKSNINANVSSGNYDNILQDSFTCKKFHVVYVFWELCNLINGFQYKSNSLNKNETHEFINQLKSEIDIVFNNLKHNRLVIFNKFSTLVFNHHYLKENNFDYICKELNSYLDDKKNSNTVLVDIDKVISKISIDKSVDFRMFYSSKSLYSLEFLMAYSNYTDPIYNSVLGNSKKALIFDCDNTLWNGILGEDGESGILMSGNTRKGVYFEEIQYLAKQLSSNGVIIGLNSKNNLNDVNQILRNHNDMILHESDVAIVKVNWNDKVSNLLEISKDLNIGINSIVFIDDSDFEVNLVKELLPDVNTFQVPKRLYEYPKFLRNISESFYTISITNDDLARTHSYKSQLLRENNKKDFLNINDYLNSLNLEVSIDIDNILKCERIAQLTQKTNQFNLTTKRYTISDIENFILSSNYIVMSMSVTDKFGDFGITGVSIIQLNQDIAYIDSFLLSCRVIGRNIEFVLLNEIAKLLSKKNVKKIQSTYIKTFKNSLVSNFYDEAGFPIINNSSELKSYEIILTDFYYDKLNTIKVKYESKN